MPRRAVALECTPEIYKELKTLSRGKKIEKRLCDRAKMILSCLDGKKNQEVACEFGVRPETVSHWRRGFSEQGIKGLYDKSRSGKPKKYNEELRSKLLKILELPPPKGQASWDGQTLAKEVGASDDAVWRILRKEGVQLQRSRSWCVSTDKEFSAKAADIIGLYLNPPINALVICVDEKPSIQALERARGYVETSSGKIVQGMKSTYKRHGTLNLFAALNVATGAVSTKTTTQKKRPDFQEFMDSVVKDIAADKEIHVILDNYSTHKKNETWLAAHPNVKFHFTPTSASWLNQVEIWFGIFSRKALKNASFNSTEALKKAIEDYIEVYKTTARPFVWRKREVKGTQLKNTLANLCN